MALSLLVAVLKKGVFWPKKRGVKNDENVAGMHGALFFFSDCRFARNRAAILYNMRAQNLGWGRVFGKSTDFSFHDWVGKKQFDARPDKPVHTKPTAL